MYTIFFVFLSSCIDEINLNVPGKERDSIVINGKFLVRGDGWVDVHIQQLFDFTASSRSAIDLERVELWDATGDIVQLERQSYARFTRHIPEGIEGFDLIPGDAYILKVFIAEGEYFSDSVILHSFPEGISFSWEPDTLHSMGTLRYFIELDNINDWQKNYWIRYQLNSAYKFSDYINQECYVFKYTVMNSENYYDLTNLKNAGIKKMEFFYSPSMMS